MSLLSILMSKSRTRRESQHSAASGLRDGRKLKRLQQSTFHNPRHHDQDSRTKFRSSLLSLPVKLSKLKDNPASRGGPYRRGRNNSSLDNQAKASASNSTDDSVSRYHDKESKRGNLISRKSSMSLVEELFRMSSDPTVREESPDIEAEIERKKPRKGRFLSDPEYSLQDTAQCDMILTTKKFELCDPSVARGVKVVYTTDALEVKEWLKAHIIDCGERVIGFDMEWKPQIVSKRNGGTENQTAVLQLAVEKSCLVSHIYHITKLPKSLKRVLKDKTIKKVGSGISQDGLKLERDRGLVMKGLADIQVMAKKTYPLMVKTGIQALADRFLGIELDKTAALSNWEIFPLQDLQIKYAALDAWVALQIFHEMKSSV